VAPDDKRNLSPRLEQVLSCLLRGDGEKEIAYTLTLSIHTVHCHVGTIYKAFDVHARSELLALFLERTAAERDALLRINAAICSPPPTSRELSGHPTVRDVGTGHRPRYRLASRRTRRG
jgi:DNA-binding CsgD family transcriptional regulator